jgi:hypothetical protein
MINAGSRSVVDHHHHILCAKPCGHRKPRSHRLLPRYATRSPMHNAVSKGSSGAVIVGWFHNYDGTAGRMSKERINTPRQHRFAAKLEILFGHAALSTQTLSAGNDDGDEGRVG